MTTLIPNTASPQSFKLRTRESGSQLPFSVYVEIQNEFTYYSSSISPASSSYYDDWLVITGSFDLEPNTFYGINVDQYSGSTLVKQLYRGEIYATTQSANVLTSEPMFGYVATSSVNQYITY